MPSEKRARQKLRFDVPFSEEEEEELLRTRRVFKEKGEAAAIKLPRSTSFDDRTKSKQAQMAVEKAQQLHEELLMEYAREATRKSNLSVDKPQPEAATQRPSSNSPSRKKFVTGASSNLSTRSACEREKDMDSPPPSVTTSSSNAKPKMKALDLPSRTAPHPPRQASPSRIAAPEPSAAGSRLTSSDQGSQGPTYSYDVLSTSTPREYVS